MQYLGWRPRLWEAFADHDLLVVPSTILEAFGLVAIEAQACGLPVAYQPVPGLREVLAASALPLDPTDPAAPMTTDTVFDMANLTKIMAVWAPVGMLWENGNLALDDPLAALLPDLHGYPLGHVTVHQLLTHTAGVPLRANLKALYGTDPAAIRRGVLHEQLHRPPGEAVEYTDRAALILGFLIEHLTATGLHDTAHEHIWAPLGMTQTGFGPLPPRVAARCAPTELDEQTGAHLKGIAHDFSARLLGGGCGIAGAFSTLTDIRNTFRELVFP